MAADGYVRRFLIQRALRSLVVATELCTFRSSGKKFNVDRFLAKSPWQAAAIYRRGSNQSGRYFSRSGFNLGVSDADWYSLSKQVEDALLFLLHNKEELNRLSCFPGVESLALDFPVYCKITQLNQYVQEEFFPKDLVRLAGKIGIGLNLSIYRGRAKLRRRRNSQALPDSRNC
jgi:hypothetical protein